MGRVPETQLESWEKCKEEGLPEKLWRVREVIRARGGATTFEVAEALGWSVHCVSGKITNLKDRGRVRDSGARKVNVTASAKRNVIVWEACDQQVVKPVTKWQTCTRCDGTGQEPANKQTELPL